MAAQHQRIYLAFSARGSNNPINDPPYAVSLLLLPHGADSKSDVPVAHEFRYHNYVDSADGKEKWKFLMSFTRARAVPLLALIPLCTIRPVYLSDVVKKLSSIGPQPGGHDSPRSYVIQAMVTLMQSNYMPAIFNGDAYISAKEIYKFGVDFTHTCKEQRRCNARLPVPAKTLEGVEYASELGPFV
ncbi:hypothetical protein SISNIDRAFT_461516 [Sistotremastrum niveocremeum HHB9708]|uniref:Uncharacterized protein n=2 Tax=Sistotremastraceae TaxID=3402574 RepID=A0A164MJJ9_9AGAM|nr:hypothetical protein SISNIDRAFT_461516 [Sistotremastrum niveocremeum HHB9708]KZT35987.1 hypothetical protein SISSUDRAFT_1050567 [Sistotremastrum suecicum HHB10207 ss-3]